MAKNTTGSGSTVEGSTFVHPDNMGKGLLWDEETKQYEVGLSRGNGNLLEVRADGLYYGIEAPADTSNLYVSSSTGDDSNKGTRTSPLKTIREAFRRNSVGTRFTIHLLETDVHEWRSSWGRPSGKVFAIKPYGSKFDEVSLRNPVGSYTLYRCNEIIRPRISFIPDNESLFAGTNYNDAGTYVTNDPITVPITFFACTLDLRAEPTLPINPNSRSVIGFSGNTPSSMYFIGCNFLLGNQLRLVTVDESCDLVLDNAKIDSSQGSKFILMLSRGMMNFSYINYFTGRQGEQATGTPSGQTPLTLREGTSNNTILALIEGTNSSRVAKTHILTNVDLE